MTMVSNFTIVFVFSKLFCVISISANVECKRLDLDIILALFLLTVTFSPFQNELHWLHFPLKKHKTFSCSLLHNICLCFIFSNAHIVDIWYPQGIFLPIFVAADFPRLFLQLSVTFYSKIEVLHRFSALKDRRQFKQ